MQSFKEVFRLNEEDAPTNTTDAVAGKDQPLFKVSRVAGCDCIEVDHETYDRCKFGKKKYGRWSGYIEDETLRSFVKEKFARAQKLMFTNASTGASVLFKR